MSTPVAVGVTRCAVSLAPLVAVPEAGVLTNDAVTQLGDVLAGKAAGRRSPDEATVFDSTGLAIQDLAVCIEVVDRANDDASIDVQMIEIG